MGKLSGESFDAAVRSRSNLSIPLRDRDRSPARAVAPVQRSKRTPPHEGSVSGRSDAGRHRDRLGEPTMDSKETKGPFQEQFRLFVGFDWAKDHHDVAAVDAAGKVILELSFPDTAEGWAQLCQQLTEQDGPGPCPSSLGP